MMTAGNMKIALPENIALLLHSHVDVPWSLVVILEWTKLAWTPVLGLYL